jgi:hypothetical protein
VKKLIILVAAFMCAFSSLAEAKHRHHKHHFHHHRHVARQVVVQSTFGFFTPVVRTAEFVGRHVLPHPAGCPARAFCACGAAVEHFGRPIRSLWTASSWYRFHRAAPAPGMAAVRPHHVFTLVSHYQGDVWYVKDYNTGHHLSLLHLRSIRGFTIVDPHA